MPLAISSIHKKNKSNMDKITRREFVRSAAIGGTALALTATIDRIGLSASADRVTLVAGGDAMVTRSLEPFLAAGDRKYKEIVKLIKDSDIAMVNLETCLTRSGYPAEKLATLRGEPSIAAELRRLGIDIVTVANNHIMDFGYEGLFETLRALDSNQIKHVGAGKDIEEAMAPAMLERENIKVGFLGFSSCLPLGAEAGKSRPGVAPIRVSTAFEADPTVMQEQPGTFPAVRTWAREDDVQAMKAAIGRTKAAVDFLVVTIHWGVAYQNYLAEYQQPLAHAMVDSGADLVVGHHPHVPHAIETYKKKHIFYGLGNFFVLYQGSENVSRYLRKIGIDSESVNTRETFAVRISIEKAGGSVTTEIIPIVIDEDGFPNLADEAVSKRIIDRVRKLSESWVTIEMKGNLGIVKS